MSPALGGIAMLVGTLASVPASAEEVTRSVAAVQACLCARAAVEDRQSEVKAEQKTYDQSKRETESLSRQVADARARLNTENRDDINAFTALLQRSGEAEQAFRGESARMAAVVNRYNEAVNGNNAMCVGRLFDTEEVEAVKGTLTCPR